MEDNIINFKGSENEISLKQAADILGLPYSTARRRIFDSKNNIRFYDFGGGVYKIIESDVRRYKAKCQRGGFQDSTQKNLG